MIDDKIYHPADFLDLAVKDFPVELKDLWDHPDKIDDEMRTKLDDIHSKSSIFKDKVWESIVGVGEIMKLADGKDLRYEGSTPEEVAGIFNRVGTLIEMLGVLGIKCDEIHDQTGSAIDRYEDLKNGLIAKDGVSGHFVSSKIAR